MSRWVVDAVGPSFAQATLVEAILYAHHSPWQHIQVAQSTLFGRMLVLDDAVQTTERDEYTYHEMLTHFPLLTHPRPTRVLIIGGGDGGTLEETLKHPVQHATMVEIDQEVVDVSRKFLPAISGEAFADPRTRLLIEDGIAFVRTTSDRFDVVLVDSTDPKGPGVALFSAEFFAACARVLHDDGLLVTQSGSLFYQRDLAELVRGHLSTIFPIVCTYWSAVPAYPGGLWSFTCGSKRYDPRTVRPEDVTRRVAPLTTRYYSPTIHQMALHLPALPE